MRIVELTNKLKLPLNNEESEILDKFQESKTIAKKDLDEREQYVISKMVEKDVIRRINQEGKIVYTKKI